MYVSPTRSCRRKRICRGVRKTIIQQQLPLVQAPFDFAVEKFIPAQTQPLTQVAVNAGVHGGLAADTTGYKEIAIVPGPAPAFSSSHAVKPRTKTTTLFDDIFNVSELQNY